MVNNYKNRKKILSSYFLFHNNQNFRLLPDGRANFAFALDRTVYPRRGFQLAPPAPPGLPSLARL